MVARFMACRAPAPALRFGNQLGFRDRALEGVPREQSMLKGHLPRGGLDGGVGVTGCSLVSGVVRIMKSLSGASVKEAVSWSQVLRCLAILHTLLHHLPKGVRETEVHRARDSNFWANVC